MIKHESQNSFYFNLFLGHAFRRTSATILANTGASMETIKRHASWRSSSLAEGYIPDALHHKKNTGEIITSTIVGSIGSGSRDSATKICGNNSINNENTILEGSSGATELCGENLIDDDVRLTRLVFSAQESDSIESDAIKSLRKSFAYNVNHIEKQFEKYISKADRNSLSLDDFWRRYFGSKYTSSYPTTSPTNDIAQIATEIKMEDPIDIIDEAEELDSSDLESIFSDDSELEVQK